MVASSSNPGGSTSTRLVSLSHLVMLFCTKFIQSCQISFFIFQEKLTIKQIHGTSRIDLENFPFNLLFFILFMSLVDSCRSCSPFVHVHLSSCLFHFWVVASVRSLRLASYKYPRRRKADGEWNNFFKHSFVSPGQVMVMVMVMVVGGQVKSYLVLKLRWQWRCF